MLICMKPTSKQLSDLQARIAEAKVQKGLSWAQIGRIANVHPSQVGRICSGRFKTFSHNVVQVCEALGVSVPHLEPDTEGVVPEWAVAQSSMRRIWDETPEGAKAIAKLLNAIADLQHAREGEPPKST
ncbi:helix-turn-helix domain-containing protein [Azospirillum sp.]|uniref:helix-turn-helix domain-containing protein n=1 Tax=Azospirillum sp. TaxID=34012 RepID=UPI0039C89CDC